MSNEQSERLRQRAPRGKDGLLEVVSDNQGTSSRFKLHHDILRIELFPRLFVSRVVHLPMLTQQNTYPSHANLGVPLLHGAIRRSYIETKH